MNFPFARGATELSERGDAVSAVLSAILNALLRIIVGVGFVILVSFRTAAGAGDSGGNKGPYTGPGLRVVHNRLFDGSMTIGPPTFPGAPATGPPEADRKMAGARRAVTVRTLIESVRYLSWEGCNEGVCISPDGSAFIVVTARGDLNRDRVLVEIRSGSTSSLAAAALGPPITLTATGYGEGNHLAHNCVQWINHNQQVAFLWSDRKGTRQVYALDLRTRSFAPRTSHPDDIFAFTFSSDGKGLAFRARSARDIAAVNQLKRNGYSIRNANAYNFFDDYIEGFDPWADVDLFVAADQKSAPQLVLVPGVKTAGMYGPMLFDPQSRRLLVQLAVPYRSRDWDAYTATFIRNDELPRAKRAPSEAVLSQLYIYDTKTNALTPLLDAPAGWHTEAIWSPGGESIVLTQALLPVRNASANGLAGTAIAEVDVLTSRVTELPVNALPGGSSAFHPVAWTSEGLVLSDGFHDTRLQKRREGWREIEMPALPVSRKSSIRLETRQTLNTPPEISAVDSSGRSTILLKLNPTLAAQYGLVPVELIEWSDSDNRLWQGLLYRPAGPPPIQGFPLVIQTHGFSTTEFSLSGNNSTPSVFAAQPLASSGIAVLQMGYPKGQKGTESWWISPQEAIIHSRGIDGAIAYLANLTLIDTTRVGITGFSRTGWHVEYVLTHSDFPYAAAIVADSIDNSYVQSAMRDWTTVADSFNGGEPFGAGLKFWLENAPSFSVERIRTPVRLQVLQGTRGYILSKWELFGRLRRLNLPVELYIIPNLAQGGHSLQNPRQLLASAGGAVAWYEFWLHGKPKVADESSDRRTEWQMLKEQQDAALTRPRPPLLEWSATPRTHAERASSALPSQDSPGGSP